MSPSEKIQHLNDELLNLRKEIGHELSQIFFCLMEPPDVDMARRRILKALDILGGAPVGTPHTPITS